MSLQTILESGGIGGVLAKAAMIAQAKGAEAMVLAGGALAAAGLLFGSHAVTDLRSAKAAQAQTIAYETATSQARTSLMQYEEVINNDQKARILHVMDSAVINRQPAVITARQMLLNIPHMAIADHVAIKSIGNPSEQSNLITQEMVPANPGLYMVNMNLSGSYTTLSGLRNFLNQLPMTAAVTGLSIDNDQFNAKVNVYGVAA